MAKHASKTHADKAVSGHIRQQSQVRDCANVCIHT